MNSAQYKIALFQFAEKVMGRSNMERWYLKRCIRVYIQNKIIFIHIPKAAGTSISYELLGQRAGHFSAEDVKNFLGKEAFAKMLSFTVVRHPTDRLKSAYQYAKQGGGTEGGVRKLPVYSSNVFKTFESFVLEWLPSIDLEQAPIIFRPQHTFVCDADDNILVQHVAQLEHLSDLEIFLAEELGHPVLFERRNISKQETAIPISMEVHQRILALYRKDFEIFGYTPYTA